MTFLNIAAYKFVTLTELPTLRTVLKARAAENDLCGTILLSTEGINLSLAGHPEKIDCFRDFLKKDMRFNDLEYKESVSSHKTYNRLLVKIKKEIIAFSVEGIDPEHHTAPYMEPETLKQLLDNQSDIILLDTRNQYEIHDGTFDNAMELDIQNFKQFPDAIKNLDPALKDKTIVTFCTGGIRCEKAAPFMQQQGFKNIYQLKGGILNYFLKCGSAHYHGDCFVFDQRQGVDTQLKPSISSTPLETK